MASELVPNPKDSPLGPWHLICGSAHRNSPRTFAYMTKQSSSQNFDVFVVLDSSVVPNAEASKKKYSSLSPFDAIVMWLTHARGERNTRHPCVRDKKFRLKSIVAAWMNMLLGDMDQRSLRF